MKTVTYPLKNAVIGILSDTHIPARARVLPPQIFSVFEGVSLILHAGDIEHENVLMELETIAPVEAVAGNMDPPELKIRLGMAKIVSFSGASLGLFHGYGAPGASVQRALEQFRSHDVNAVVFGHTHEPRVEKRDGLLMINPGSVSDPRRGSKPSCALLHLDNAKMEGEIIVLA